MKVVDSNLLIYLAADNRQGDAARAWHAHDPDWCVPPLAWSEVANVLLGYVRRGTVSAQLAKASLEALQARVVTLAPNAIADVVDAALATGLTAYDAEFVVAARSAGLKLLTNDTAVLRACPDVAFALDAVPEAVGG